MAENTKPTAAEKSAVVLAALVIAKRADGSDVYLYEGAPWPEGLADGEFDRLHDLEMVGKPGEFDK